MTDKDQPISRAAEILGKSPSTILRWIHSGKVPATKVDGEWRVDVSGAMPSEMTDHADVMSEKDAEIADLKQEIDLLKSQLAQKDSQIAALDQRLHEAHVLIQQKALPEPGKRPWWMFWKR
jgi:excisionase family DNA binding protein